MTSKGVAAPEQVLQQLFDEGRAILSKIKWGRGYRSIVTIDSKKYQYTKGGNINKMIIKNYTFI
jgi:hypothetical protein